MIYCLLCNKKLEFLDTGATEYGYLCADCKKAVLRVGKNQVDHLNQMADTMKELGRLKGLPLGAFVQPYTPDLVQQQREYNEIANTLTCIAAPKDAEISDGYHTMSELYDHRCILFILLCRVTESEHDWNIWRYKESDEWFLLGINHVPGYQITYHIPVKYWDMCGFAITETKQPEFDGHTSADVLERLKELI